MQYNHKPTPDASDGTGQDGPLLHPPKSTQFGYTYRVDMKYA